MNSRPAEKIDDNNGQLQTQRSKTVSTINSTDALAMVEHGSELTLSITTPVGTKFVCRTRLLGLIPTNFCSLKCPKFLLTICNSSFKKGSG